MPSSCYSGSIDPETLFSACHQNLQKIFPKMSKLGLWAWALQSQILAKYPLFSPILGGISKPIKIDINRIGSKFTCSILGPIAKPEKIFSSNGAILAKFGTNRIFQLDNFSWGRTFKNLKNSKIKNFRKLFPKQVFPGRSTLKSPKKVFSARLEARNSSK